MTPEQTFTIIPAIDIIDGKCVRLVKGDYKQKTVYHEDPLTAAKLFVNPVLFLCRHQNL